MCARSDGGVCALFSLSLFFCLCHMCALCKYGFQHRQIRTKEWGAYTVQWRVIEHVFSFFGISAYFTFYIWKCVDFSTPFFSFIRSKSCIYPIFAHMSAQNNQTKWEAQRKKKNRWHKKNEISLNKYRLRRHISRVLS